MPELPQPLPPHLPGDEPPANDASLRGLTMALDARRAAALLEECCRCMEGMPKRGAAMQWGVQWLARQGLSTSAKSLERKFYAWLGGGKSQLALVDRRKVLGKNTGKGIHAPAFQLYWVGLVAQYQRSVKSAYRELCRAWFAGQVIPGYETAWDRRALPEGWSYRNLCNALPTAAELDIYRKGMDQAHALMPSVRTTRAGSYPTEFVFFDDVWVDRLSRFGREINRCMQLGALDFFTGMRLTAGTKFRHRRADGTHVYFIQDDMLMQVAAYLHDIGYNARRGTTLVVENGTAAITPEMEAMLQALTAGKVRVERSGMIGMRQLIRGYAGRAKGNPRDKAPLESWHSLFHNRLCHGRLGRQRPHAPRNRARHHRGGKAAHQKPARLAHRPRSPLPGAPADLRRTLRGNRPRHRRNQPALRPRAGGLARRRLRAPRVHPGPRQRRLGRCG